LWHAVLYSRNAPYYAPKSHPQQHHCGKDAPLNLCIEIFHPSVYLVIGYLKRTSKREVKQHHGFRQPNKNKGFRAVYLLQ